MSKRKHQYIDEPVNLWTKYYTQQAITGYGINGFYGDIYQRGDGLWGDLFRKIALPVIKYLGRKGASTLIKAGGDALAGENFVNSLKKHGKATAQDIVSDTADRATTFLQTGKGRQLKRRKRKLNTTKSIKSKRSRKSAIDNRLFF